MATGLIVVGVALLREAVFGHVAHETGFDLDWRAVALVSGGLLLQMLLLEGLGWIIATTADVRRGDAGLPRAPGADQRPDRPGPDRARPSAIFNYGLGLGLPTGTVIEDMLAGPEEGE